MNNSPEMRTVFLEHLDLLDRLYDCGQNHYLVIKEKIDLFKSLSLPLIGSPLSHLLNAQIKQNYLVIQHIDNCLVYKSLLTPQTEIDEDLSEQLSGLIKITIELKASSEAIKDEFYRFLKEEFNSKNSKRAACF